MSRVILHHNVRGVVAVTVKKQASFNEGGQFDTYHVEGHTPSSDYDYNTEDRDEAIGVARNIVESTGESLPLIY